MILQALRTAIESVVGAFEFQTDEAVVLTGFYVIAEWSTADGEKWLTRTHGDLNDEGLADWTAKGFLKYALDAVDRVEAPSDDA